MTESLFLSILRRRHSSLNNFLLFFLSFTQTPLAAQVLQRMQRCLLSILRCHTKDLATTYLEPMVHDLRQVEGHY